MTECTFIYRNISYYRNINLVSGLDLQLHGQLRVFTHLLSSADNGLYSCTIFLDFSKAFDTVNHNMLFDKFYHNFGIRGIPLQLFRSYLSNRKQFVKLENAKSGLADISNGVPQGSVLGPLLFIMYINDLPKSSAFYTVLYADDTYLCLSHKNLDDLQHMVNVELIKVDNWLRLCLQNF